MAVKITADRVLTNFLRNRLTDINPSRSGYWVFPDFPRIKDLGDASFPRIGITILTDNSNPMGIFDDTQYHAISVQIDCVTKKDLGFTKTVTDEALGTMSSSVNSSRMTYTYIPTAVTNIKHGGVAYGTVTLKNTDADFTAPAGLAAGTVEVSKSTGNLNFSSADGGAHDGQAITSTYTVYLE